MIFIAIRQSSVQLNHIHSVSLSIKGVKDIFWFTIFKAKRFYGSDYISVHELYTATTTTWILCHLLSLPRDVYSFYWSRQQINDNCYCCFFQSQHYEILPKNGTAEYVMYSNRDNKLVLHDRTFTVINWPDINKNFNKSAQNTLWIPTCICECRKICFFLLPLYIHVHQFKWVIEMNLLVSFIVPKYASYLEFVPDGTLKKWPHLVDHDWRFFLKFEEFSADLYFTLDRHQGIANGHTKKWWHFHFHGDIYHYKSFTLHVFTSTYVPILFGVIRL